MELKLLVDMYKIFSISGKEDGIRKIVTKELNKLKIPYKIDKQGNVYRIQKDSILLCSHMDQVSYYPVENVVIADNIIFGDGNLGADDKNGIWINLSLLKKFNKSHKLSFIFSTCEEIGGNINKLLKDKKIKTVKYGLIFDRRNGSDIIGTKNNYCCKEFEDDLVNLGKELGYKPNSGIFSDCNNLSEYISCVNLSCGYYNAHTSTEYTKISELYNALEFGKRIIENMDKKYDKPNKSKSKTEYIDYSYESVFFCRQCDEYYNDYEININSLGEHICWLCDSKLDKINFNYINYTDYTDYTDYDEQYEGFRKNY